MEITPQKAIVLLSQMYLPQFDDEEKEALSIAIYALEKQIPKKVKYQNRHGEGKDYYNKDYFHCPCCGRRLRNKQKDAHCGKCGQTLDWEI